jgi:hypothetical protein
MRTLNTVTDMWWPGLLVMVSGCDLVLGLEAHHNVDAGVGDGERRDLDAEIRPDAAVDARPCNGGDAHMMGPSSCFLWFAGPLPFAQAQTQCAAIASHLAFIRTAGDDAVVEAMVGMRAAYIGATDQATEGTFLWLDGSAVTFTNWRAGEPNNGGGIQEEDCAVIAGDQGPGWDDRPCTQQPGGAGSYAYLCQY